MTLSRIKDFEASSRRCFRQNDIMHFQVCIAQDKVGQVLDILVDQTGNFQYLIVELNQEIGNKQLLIPYNESQIDEMRQCINVSRIDTQVTDMACNCPTDILREGSNNNTIEYSLDEEGSRSYPL